MSVMRDRDKRELKFGGQDNIQKLLKHFELENFKEYNIPIRVGTNVEPCNDERKMTNKPYRSLIGSVNYPSQWFRPDIAYAVGYASQFMQNPTEEHWNIGLDIARYLNKTQHYVMSYNQGENYDVVGYADSNFANDKISGKSIFGYIIYVGGNPVSWKSKKASITATSTTIAEIDAIYNCATECKWIHELVRGLKLKTESTFRIKSDSESAIKVLNGEKYLDRTKHETVKIEYLRDLIRMLKMNVTWIGTREMIADAMTKGLAGQVFENHVREMKLVEHMIVKGVT